MSSPNGFLDKIRSIQVEVKDIQRIHKISVDYGILDTILHPYDYADILIRLGYEPFPPLQKSHLFHPPTLQLIGINSYVYYLYSVDGFTGIFRTVVPFVASTLIYRHLNSYITNRCPVPLEHPAREPRLCETFTENSVYHFIKVRCWKMLSSIIALHVCYPLHVIAVRTMARFVTFNTTSEGYREPVQFSWIDEIKKITSFGELYAGMQSRILREIAFATISAGSFLALMKLIHLLQTDLLQADPIERVMEYISNSIGIVYSTPFRNASDIMIVNNTDILLGGYPFNEEYLSCWDCLYRLGMERRWKISAGSFFAGRLYMGTRDMIDGKLLPRETIFGPYYMPLGARGFEDVPYFLYDYYNAWKVLGVTTGNQLSALESVFKLKKDTGKSGQETRPKSNALSGEMMSSVFTGPGILFSVLFELSNPLKI